MAAMYSSGQESSGTVTMGSSRRTISRSAGLSSTKTKLSGRMLISLAMAAMFRCFGSQLALKQRKSSAFRTLSARSKPVRAMDSSFLLHTFSRMPSLPRAFR